MSAGTLIAGAFVVLGLVGVVLPVLPGSLLVGAGVLVWALDERTAVTWGVLGVALVLLAAGQVGSWVLAGRSLVAAPVPRRSLLAARCRRGGGGVRRPGRGPGAGGVLGLHLAELVRLGPGTTPVRSALAAAGALAVAVGVELAGAVAAALTWLVAAVATA